MWPKIKIRVMYWSKHQCLTNTVNHLLTPQGAYLFQTSLRGGGRGRLIETGTYLRGGLIKFSDDIGIGSPSIPRMQSGKAQVQEVGGHAEV